MRGRAQVQVIAAGAAVAVVAVSTALVLTSRGDSKGGGSAPPEAAGGLVTYGKPTYVDAIPDEQAAVGSEAAELVEFHERDFLGSYPEGSYIVLVTSTARGKRMATRHFGDEPAVEVRSSPFSLATASAQADRLRESTPSLQRRVYQWGADPAVGGVLLMMESPSNADRKTIEEFAAAHDLPIRVEIDDGGGNATLD